MRTFADAEARLAETLPGYEARPQQQALARAVESAFATRTHLLGEAGTGTGKSLGYLIPALLAGKRVVVSTATKALQDQLAGSDLPFLEESLGVPFAWALLKGRSNYLCPAKALDADYTPGVARVLQRYQAALDAAAEGGEVDFDGQRATLGFEVSDADWMAVAADSDDCSAIGCNEEEHPRCYAEQARRAAKQADVVVVNHALAMTDLSLKQVTGGVGLLGRYDAIVFDEAHEVEEYAASTLGIRLTHGTFISLVGQTRKFARKLGDDAIEESGKDVLGAAQALFEVLGEGRLRQGAILEHEARWFTLATALQTLANQVVSANTLDYPGTREEATKNHERVSKRATSAMEKFLRVISDDWTDYVRYVEAERRPGGQERLALYSAPISVAETLRRWLFANPEQPVTAILVSATLTAGPKGFTFIAERLGVDTYESLDVGTPFTYQDQAALLVPGHLPPPRGDTMGQWASMATATMIDLVRASQGRALVLFTSVQRMREAAQALRSVLPYPVRVQGEAPNQVLSEWFKDTEEGVLVATRSFMTGVDFRGDTLQLVIIEKMPFAVPTEPLTEARCEAIEANGGSAFRDYSLPEMSLVLKQAFGRLIRHRDDRGVVAILDPRLDSSGWGRSVKRTLPPARPITTLGEAEEFFSAAPALA